MLRREGRLAKPSGKVSYLWQAREENHRTSSASSIQRRSLQKGNSITNPGPSPPWTVLLAQAGKNQSAVWATCEGITPVAGIPAPPRFSFPMAALCYVFYCIPKRTLVKASCANP